MNFRLSYHFSGTLLLLAATFAVARVTEQRHSQPLAEPLETIPLEMQGFVGVPNPPLPGGVLKELKATSYISRNYRRAGITAELFIAFYARQRAGESMHSPKHCLPGSGWEIWDYDTIDIPATGRRFLINKYSISHDGDRRVVLYWYQSKNRIFGSEYLGKLLLARDALLQNSTSAAIVRLIVPDQPGAVEEVSALASGVIVQMQHRFGE